MEVRVHTRNAAITDAARQSVTEKVSHATRFFDDQVGDLDVELSEEHNPRMAAERYRVEITTIAAGRVIRVVSAAGTLDGAADQAVDRFNRQLLRLKNRLIGRGRRNNNKEQAVETTEAADPEIVRIKQFVMKPMTVEEAMLQMELLGHDFFFFHSLATGLQSVLYRRRDGHLGLIEPA